MTTLHVQPFLSLFGGGTHVIIEDQDFYNNTYWSGTVDEWFSCEDKALVAELAEDEVLTSSIDDNSLIIRVSRKII